MQNTNPLFPSSNDPPPPIDGYSLAKQPVEHPVGGGKLPGAVEAADLIREKLKRIYQQEPDPFTEAREAEVIKPRSKHQQFMYQLSTSGKSLATIQTEWHNYYTNLSDQDKHDVWREFYDDYGAAKGTPHSYHYVAQPQPTVTPPKTHTPPPIQTTASGIVVSNHQPSATTLNGPRSVSQLRQLIRDKVSANGRLRPKHHLQSLGFGLAVGLAVLIVFMFSFFNQIFIIPFIQPGNTASATPIIVDPSSVTPSSTPQVIVPKISVDIPIDFSVTSTNENVIENDLEAGVVHYPSTVLPGQIGNSAYFGHSSNNIFNPGKYKFAFVLLHTLVPGDTFYIINNGKVYIYKVFETQVVSPNDVGVLDNVPGHAATATLITCDPPGTSINRLIVVGDQISPDPSTNGGGTNTSTLLAPSTQLPSNGPTLWSRFWNWLF
jgi:LPXTG-site transpeptidase (sortase) family protein